MNKCGDDGPIEENGPNDDDNNIVDYETIRATTL